MPELPEMELYRTTRGFEEDAALRTELETEQGYKLYAVFETPASAQSAAVELTGQDIRFVKHISTTGVETWEVYAKPPAVKTEILPMSIVEYDRRYTLEELREMAKQAGLSSSGSKKEIAVRLIAKGVK